MIGNHNFNLKLANFAFYNIITLIQKFGVFGKAKHSHFVPDLIAKTSELLY